MELIKIAGNAFIELSEHDLPMLLTKNQIFNYGEVVGAQTGQKVDLSGAGLINLKLNYGKIIEVTQDGFYTPAKGVTPTELKARYRSDISRDEYEAYTSIKARRAIGITSITKKKTYL